MKLKNGFMLREVAGQWVIVPLGERTVEFNCIISVSESGALIWKLMEQDVSEEEIVQAILQEYDIDAETARNDIGEFIDMLKEKGLIVA